MKKEQENMQNLISFNFNRCIKFRVFIANDTFSRRFYRACYHSEFNYYHYNIIKLDGLKMCKFQSSFRRIQVQKHYCIFNNNNLLDDVLKTKRKRNECRHNQINLQMLPENLYNQIFVHDEYNLDSIEQSNVHAIKKELQSFGISTYNTTEIPNVNISIPKLKSQNIEEHFKVIANEQVQPYLKIITNILTELPPMPSHFIFDEGWTRYSNFGHESVSYPKEDGLIFDVEVCMKSGPLPTLAIAVSKSSWYSWVSKQLIHDTSSFIFKYLTPESLIPLESSVNDKGINLNEFQQMPKIIIGHNVSFDRARVKEQYWLNKTGTKFLDTMALHICVSGLSSYQRAILKSINLKNEQEHEYLNSISSLNNLSDIHKLYCGSSLSKDDRDIFINGEIQDIRKHFNELMLYCASDVVATHKVLKKIFPIFTERFPHPATLAGMLELSTTYLPVNYNWKRYLEEAETIYEDLNFESKVCLSKRADEVCRLSTNNQYKNDPWMWDEDWTIKKINLKKGYDRTSESSMIASVNTVVKSILNKQFRYLHKAKTFLPRKLPHMPGYPNWYRKLCEKNKVNVFPRIQKLSTSMLITPKLLNLTWQQYPLHHIKNHGWGFLVHDSVINSKKEQYDCDSLHKRMEEKWLYLNPSLSGSHYKYSDTISSHTKINNFYFFKLPHKDGISYNVGNPLSKDFSNNFSKNILHSITVSTSRIIEISRMSSYWKNNRDRILSQLVIWLDSKQKNINSKDNFTNSGSIIPQVVVSGTLTRRAVEPTWMTASNTHCERIGSELRAMINAPSGYNIIGADVDSQELWIASIIGDAFNKDSKIHGGTPFSWMTLIGNKCNGTDMHSVTAKAIGITRDQAKILNYARIYGAGQKFTERLLKQFNPSITDKEAISKSKQIFLMTKGKKYYRLKKEYISQNLSNKLYTSSETFKISQIKNKLRDEVFEKGKWFGGSESSMFNNLEEIAEQKEPATPFLNARLSRALEHERNQKSLPTKINWVVQSGAVDFLHLILVTMRWLMKDKISLCLSFHDEVRYLVPSDYKYNAALAMHVTNLLVRCFFVSRLKMKDLPMSVAFFNAVEVDSVLRKETTEDCITPSNPHGLKEGYGVQSGETLDIWTAIHKSKGQVGILK